MLPIQIGKNIMSEFVLSEKYVENANETEAKVFAQKREG